MLKIAYCLTKVVDGSVVRRVSDKVFEEYNQSDFNKSYVRHNIRNKILILNPGFRLDNYSAII